jgi:hypothetical protein
MPSSHSRCRGHQRQDPGERVGGADEGSHRPGQRVHQVEVEDVDDEKDRGQREEGREEGDEAANHDLRRASGDAQRPPPGDEEPGQLHAGDGDEQAGEDADRSQALDHEHQRLSRHGGLESGEDVAGGGDEAGCGRIEGVAAARRGGPKVTPGRCSQRGRGGEEEVARYGSDQPPQRGPGGLRQSRRRADRRRGPNLLGGVPRRWTWRSERRSSPEAHAWARSRPWAAGVDVLLPATVLSGAPVELLRLDPRTQRPYSHA